MSAHRKDITIRLTALLGMLMALILSAPASSSEVSRTPNDLLCEWRITGAIVAGDLQRIKSQLDSVFSFDLDGRLRRICLDSPGGNLSEALKIAKHIYSKWGTGVPRNAVCDSACAIVFMAGSVSTESHRGIVTDRTLHPLGQLGFHVPALDVADGIYTKSNIQSAFQVATTAVSGIIDISDEIRFSKSLLAEMLRTPSEGAFRIDTVQKAARWEIDIRPIVMPEAVNDLAMLNACNNFVSRAHDVNPHTFAKEYYDMPSLVDFRDASFGSSHFVDGYGSEASWSCHIHEFADRAYPTYMGIEGVVEGRFLPFMAFSGSTPIADLALVSDEVPQSAGVAKISRPLGSSELGQCYVLKNEVIIDQENCIQIGSKFIDENLTRHIERKFIWPSGSVTTLEQLDVPNPPQYEGEPSTFRRTTRINGTTVVQGEDRQSATLLTILNSGEPLRCYTNPDDERLCRMNCATNSSTGNRFCFVPDE